MDKKKKKKHPGWLKKLRSRYRLMLINETNFQEKLSVGLTPLNIIFIFCAGFLLFFTFSYLLIFAVPALRVYMPGYQPDEEKVFKTNTIQRLKDYDKKLRLLEEKEKMLHVMLSGEEIRMEDMAVMKQEMEQVDSLTEKWSSGYTITEPTGNVYFTGQGNEIRLEGLFYAPVKGKITSTFEKTLHPAVDIVPYKDESIKAALDGTIIFSSWTPDFGNVICIQHADNWLTVYKHCANAIKKKGMRVRTGEIIAVLGNSGELSSGPHLHFELWHNGMALNPVDFIGF